MKSPWEVGILEIVIMFGFKASDWRTQALVHGHFFQVLEWYKQADRDFLEYMWWEMGVSHQPGDKGWFHDLEYKQTIKRSNYCIQIKSWTFNQKRKLKNINTELSNANKIRYSKIMKVNSIDC